MRGVFIFAAYMAISLNDPVGAQPSPPTQSTVVDLTEATSHFAELFENTCYRHRHTLANLQTEPPSPEWQKIPGVFPIREENQGSNTLVEWGRWSHGVPYTTALVVFDSNPTVTSCIVSASHMDKATLPAVISRIDDLKILKESHEDDDKIAAIGSDSQRSLRIVCTTPIANRLFNGQCALWLAPDAGS